MKTILKRIGVCIAGFIFGIILSILFVFIADRVIDFSGGYSSGPPKVEDLGVEGWNAQFTQYLGERKSASVTKGIIDKIIVSNKNDNTILKNGEKRIIYVSSNGNVKKVNSGGIVYEQSIEKENIYLNEDLEELRTLISARDRVYSISVVDYYEDGYIKEILIEAKER